MAEAEGKLNLAPLDGGRPTSPWVILQCTDDVRVVAVPDPEKNTFSLVVEEGGKTDAMGEQRWEATPDHGTESYGHKALAVRLMQYINDKHEQK